MKGYKTRHPISSTIKIEIFNDLKIFSDESGIPMTKIFDRALLDYLDKMKKQS